MARELAADVPERQARTTYYHAVFLHQAGRLEQALAVAREARDWSDPTGDPDLISSGHGVLATVLSLSGRYDEALAINEGLVTRFRDVDPDPRNLAQSLHEPGHVDNLEIGLLCAVCNQRIDSCYDQPIDNEVVEPRCDNSDSESARTYFALDTSDPIVHFNRPNLRRLNTVTRTRRLRDRNRIGRACVRAGSAHAFS